MTPATVLLLDSNEDSLLIYTAVLRHYGYVVVPSADCRDGLELARQEPADLVVLELSFRDAPAWEVAAALKADPATASIPILALSTVADPGSRARALAVGVASFLVKPCAPLELAAEAARLLGRPLAS
ncbi:MAG TPA: response regulator [Longimicrobium sp.]|nr:response regulator [Longimicrobium sp.]